MSVCVCVKEYQNNKDTDPINSQPFTFVDVDVVVDVAWVLKRGSIGVAFVACGFVPRRCRLRVSSEWQSCDSCARARVCAPVLHGNGVQCTLMQKTHTCA